MTQETSSKVLIDLSGRKGLAKKFAGDIIDSPAPNLRYLAPDGSIAQGIFNPMRKYGFLAPTPNAFTTVAESDATQNFTNRIRASVYDAETAELNIAEDGDLFWTIGTAGLTNWLGATSGSPLSGSALHVTDLEIYQVNGAKKLFASYQKAGGGGGDILMATMAGPAAQWTNHNSTWLSGTCAGGINTGATNDVFMRTCDNGFMYIFDGNTIHKLDGTSAGGTNGTLTSNVLTFPFGFFLADAVDWRGNLWIGIQTMLSTVDSAFTQEGESRVCGVYVWDRQTTAVGTTDFIPLRGVREIKRLYITQEGELRAIVIAANRLVQIRRYNGSSFEVLHELSAVAYPQFRDSLGFVGDLAVWLGYDGYFYAHGRLTAGDADALFCIGDTNSTIGTNGTVGAILIVDLATSAAVPRGGIFWSGKTNGGTVVNRYWYPHSLGAIPSQGDVYAPVKMLPKLSTINYLNIFCAPTANTGSTTIATVTIFTNMSNVAFKTMAITKDMASRGYIHIPMAKPFCNSVQIAVSWSTGNVMSTDDFLPMYAEVDFTPTNTYQ